MGVAVTGIGYVNIGLFTGPSFYDLFPSLNQWAYILTRQLKRMAIPLQ